MRKSITLLLLLLLGCNTAPPNGNDRIEHDASPPSAIKQDASPSSAIEQGSDLSSDTDMHGVDLAIFKVPRPNSGEFSTEEATTLLPKFLERSTPTQKTETLVTQWRSPTQGIRIHVTADDTVEIVDYFGINLTGLESIGDALDSTLTDGNERSVLLTAEVAGWDTDTKKALIDILFQPSVQIYLVGESDG